MRKGARRQEALERVGTRIGGKWLLDDMLGFGGCATVYAATHRNGARAALKLLHPDVLSNEMLRTRFVREGRVANAVKHPGVVSVLDDDVTEDGLPYLVMELLEGRALDQRDGPDGKPKKMPVHEMVRIADAVLDVLVKAHAEGVVHRDLKPANLFVTSKGQVKVLDFGIARLAEAQRVPDEPGATREGMMMGTAAYMAPEQALAKWSEVDGRSDLFAVGATMLSLVMGRRPRQGETANDEYIMAMSEPMPPARELAPELPKPVADVIDRACAFERDARYADAAEMQNALRDAISAHAEAGRRESAPRVSLNKTQVLSESPISAAPSSGHPSSGHPASGKPASGKPSFKATLLTPESMSALSLAPSPSNAPRPATSLPPARSAPTNSAPSPPIVSVRPPAASHGKTIAFLLIAALLAIAGLVMTGLYLRAQRTAPRAAPAMTP